MIDLQHYSSCRTICSHFGENTQEQGYISKALKIDELYRVSQGSSGRLQTPGGELVMIQQTYGYVCTLTLVRLD